MYGFSLLAEFFAGLLHDNETLHGQRIQLWDQFNTCWLAVLQCQKDNTQRMLGTGQAPVPPQSLITEEFLEKMGHDLVSLCDTIERHGLVDYQMGVWEEEIISGKHAPKKTKVMRLITFPVLTQCLDLLDTSDEEALDTETRVQTGLPAHGSSRR